MSVRIAIVDYGTGNLRSVIRSLERVGAQCVVASQPEDIAAADKVILPGVGHFDTAMKRLKSTGLVDALDGFAMSRKKAVLGICLGMELFAGSSEEGGETGLGWLDAKAVRFRIEDKLCFKVPHIGWNDVLTVKESDLTKGLPPSSQFYFLHSYYLQLEDTEDMLAETSYEQTFCSAIQKNNIFGVQFHPEKSHDIGTKLLQSFVEL